MSPHPDRVRLALLGLPCLGPAITPAGAAGSGASRAVKACQRDGYPDWIRQDGTVFTATDDCISYATRHGQLYTRQPAPPEATLTVTGEGPNLLRVPLTGTSLDPFRRAELTITLADGASSIFDHPVNADGVIDLPFYDTTPVPARPASPPGPSAWTEPRSAPGPSTPTPPCRNEAPGSAAMRKGKPVAPPRQQPATTPRSPEAPGSPLAGATPSTGPA